jgi:putative peptidoglycan lipid II flippase
MPNSRVGRKSVDFETSIEGRQPREAGLEAGRSAFVTSLVMVSTSVSRVLGFVRIALIGAIFGASGNADVWNAVFTIPNNLRKLLAEGALSSAFIPTLSASLMADSSGAVPRLITRKVITLQLLILLPLVAVAAVFAAPITRVLLPFPDPAKLALSATQFRYVFGYLVLVSVGAVIMAVLNSHNVFVLPSLSPILFSVCVIAAILLFHRSLGIFANAIGVLLGGVTQVVFQLPSFFRRGYDLKPDFGFRYPQFLKILKQWLPVLASASISALTEQVAVLLASGLADGSISALSNALIFFQLPFGIFSISIVTVLFPKMSRQAALDDRQGLIETVSYGLKFILILMVPASLLYIILGRQIIAVAMQRGAFTARGTLWTAQVLQAYSYGLFSLSAFTFLQRYFYSTHDFRTPLISTAIVSVVDVLLSLWLRTTALRVSGLAIANSVAFTVGLGHLLLMAHRKLGRLEGRSILRTSLRLAVSLAPFLAFLLLFLRLSAPWWTPGSSLRNLGLLLVALTVSALLLLGMYWITGIEMLRDVIRSRVRRR